MIESLAIRPGERVADIGAGNGYWLSWLSEAVGPSGRVYAVEVEDNLVAELRERVERQQLLNVVVVRSSYADPELPDGEIDLAMTLPRPTTTSRLAPTTSAACTLDLSPRGRVAHLYDHPDAGWPIRWFQSSGHWSEPAAIREEMASVGLPPSGVVRLSACTELPDLRAGDASRVNEPTVRRIPEDRFDHLVDAATEVFIQRGYRLTQMADVARAVGVAKGSLYRYVASKEALFALCLRYADHGPSVPRPAQLPIETPKPGQLASYVKQRLAD